SLSSLLSLAEAARKYGYERPTMTEDNVLKIVKGRHPLHEFCVDVFVGNDADFGIQEDGGTRAMLLTGANFSGKSVYLKQVALITYMAHIGSFVPAESATIGLTDRILTRVRTRCVETVSKIQSTFCIDLHQVSVALRSSTERSLVVLDEFGKGTATTDGIGLFCALIESLVDRGPACPKILAATHFHGIGTEDAALLPEIQFQGWCLSVNIFFIRSREVNGVVILTVSPPPFTSVVPGRAKSSWGVHCAEIAGLPSAVLKR
ncbi:DNA mismatch repair protein muts, partial [Blyttiomyces helicus]